MGAQRCRERDLGQCSSRGLTDTLAFADRTCHSTESHGPPPPAHPEALDTAGSDATGSPVRVNACTISGSGLLFQAGRNHRLVVSVELKITLLKIANLIGVLAKVALSFPFICLEEWTVV